MKTVTDPHSSREHLSSDDGRAMFTLAPPHQHPYWGDQQRKLRAEIVDAIKDREAERTDRQRWARYQREAGKQLNATPYSKPRLSKAPDAPATWEPKPYDVGDWVEWTPEGADAPEVGSVWSRAGTHTWFVVTDRSAITGRYHTMTRSGSNKRGWEFHIGSAFVRSRGYSPSEQLELTPEPEAPDAPVTSLDAPVTTPREGAGSFLAELLARIPEAS